MSVRYIHGDCRERLKELDDASVHCVVTSPPYYGLRDYGVEGQIGIEETPRAYVETLVLIFREVRRVLRDDGTLWLNLGDSYAGSWGAQGRQGANGQMASRSIVSARQIAAAQKKASRTGSTLHLDGLKSKDLIGIPWRVAFALQADGWWLRSDVIWNKPNPMPESVADRPTSAHEHIFLLAKSERYYFDAEAVREPYAPATFERIQQATFEHQRGGPKDPLSGNRSARRALVNLKKRVQVPQIEDAPDRYSPNGRNIRNVWTVATQPFAEAHFATFPPKLIEPCIKAGSPKGGTVLDPFGGSGTVGQVAEWHQRNSILIDLNPEYVEMQKRRVGEDGLLSGLDWEKELR